MKGKLDLLTVPFYGLSLFGDRKQLLLDQISFFLEETPQDGNSIAVIFTPNPEQLVLARENEQFYQALSQADVLLPDGAGVVWALKRQGHSPTSLHRLPGREVFHDLLKLAATENKKVFLLGGKPGSAHAVVQKWNRNGIWATDDGPRENTKEILQKITAYSPDLLFVAYGAPWQEFWILENREYLQRAGVKIVQAVGGSFEYESGKVAHVSGMVENLHLEWLQRLVTEPWRWRRQLKGLTFFWFVWTGQFKTQRK